MAQAILDLIPNYIQVLVDDTVGTTTIQWWNGTAWVNLQEIINNTGEQTFQGLLTSTGAPYGAGVLPSVLGATTAQKIQSGTGSTAVATAGTAVTTAVAFPVAYVSAPLIVLGQTSASGGTAGYIVTLADAPTTTGFTATVNSYLAQTIGWSWVAIGN